MLIRFVFIFIYSSQTSLAPKAFSYGPMMYIYIYNISSSFGPDIHGKIKNKDYNTQI